MTLSSHILPWSHLHVTLDRTPTWQHRKWWRLHPRSSGSTSYAPTVVHPRRTIFKGEELINFLARREMETSRTYLKLRFLNEKCTSTIPVVLTRVRRISCSVGWYSFAPSRSKSSKKLKWHRKGSYKLVLLFMCTWQSANKISCFVLMFDLWRALHNVANGERDIWLTAFSQTNHLV